MKRFFLFNIVLISGIFWVNTSFCQQGADISPSSVLIQCKKNNPNPGVDHSRPISRDQNREIHSHMGFLSQGQSLYSALLSEKIPHKIIEYIIQHMNSVFDFQTKSRPGDQYIVALNANNELILFRYLVTPLDIYSLKQDKNKKWRAGKEKIILDKYLVNLSGIVRDSVYAGITKIAKAKYPAAQFIDIFAWEIDFQKQTRSGDRFNLLVEKYYQGEEFVCYGKILAAEYEGATIGKRKAFYFQEDEDIEDYYAPTGISLRAKAPLNYSRISSGYSHNRLHPLLGYVKPHLGIDFAAPLGAPVWAVADGKIIYRNYDRFNGNQILIDHENGFISYYNHLSRFAENIRKGDQVNQRQVIGYVGTTGLSTGPHLDYRLKKNGLFINPLRTDFPSKPLISPKNKARFERIQKTYSFFMQNAIIPEKMMIAQIEAQNLKSNRHGPLSLRIHSHQSIPAPSPFHADKRIVPTGREYL